MSLSVVVQMDPIEGINIRGDSTFALMLEAQKRGHSLFYYTPATLSLLNGVPMAQVAPVTVKDEVGQHFHLGTFISRPLADFQILLMRQDPPFDMNYITATHILDALPKTTQVFNHPYHVRNAPEKLFVTQFADLMPPTLISRDKSAIQSFRAEHGDCVMKPLYGNGGAAVFKIAAKDENFASLYDLFLTTFVEPWVTQKYLPEIKAGDKRIILIDGEVAGAINRVPAVDDLRSNLVRGGVAEPTDLTPREQEICARLKPELKKRGLLFTGIDVIGGWLTEVNVTSPTGLRAIERLGGGQLAVPIWQAIEKKYAQI